MNNKNKGFTLSEVLVSMMIIGIIMALSVNAIKMVKASYTSLAYFAFNNVKDMVGILYSGNQPNHALKAKLSLGTDVWLPTMVTYCINPNGKMVSVLKNDYEYQQEKGIQNCTARATYSGTATNLFCNSLVSLANTSGDVSCSSLSAPSISGNEPYFNIPSTPNFITTNGQRYYVSRWAFNTNVSNTYGYRLISVDLNGTRKPNLTDNNGSTGKPPDIVTFMVLDNGEVYPLGVAADNLPETSGKRIIQYLNTKLKGYYYSYKSDRTDSVPSDCINNTCNYAVVYVKNTYGEKDTGNFTYRQAYCAAYQGTNIGYPNYCSSYSKNNLCPPSTNDKAFDLCRPETVKPMFRFNFR